MGLFDKKFCSICGEKIGLLGNRKLEEAEANAPKQAIKCPYCGATTIPTANGCCEYCGAAL